MILRNFCSTKPARGRREGERSGKDRNRTRSHLKNGQNIYSGNNGEWTDGRRAKDHRQCRRYGHSKLLQKIGKKILKREGGIILIILLHLEPDRSTPFALLLFQYASTYHLLHRPVRRSGRQISPRSCSVRTMRRHNSICVQIRRGGGGGGGGGRR